jgi:hypothetical protein
MKDTLLAWNAKLGIKLAPHKKHARSAQLESIVCMVELTLAQAVFQVPIVILKVLSPARYAQLDSSVLQVQ